MFDLTLARLIVWHAEQPKSFQEKLSSGGSHGFAFNDLYSIGLGQRRRSRQTSGSFSAEEIG